MARVQSETLTVAKKTLALLFFILSSAALYWLVVAEY